MDNIKRNVRGLEFDGLNFLDMGFSGRLGAQYSAGDFSVSQEADSSR